MQPSKTPLFLILLLTGTAPFLTFSQDALSISSLKLFHATGQVEVVDVNQEPQKIDPAAISKQCLIINPGETIQTGREGKVILVGDDRAAIQLDSNTTVITPARAEAAHSLSLLNGKLFLKVRPAKKSTVGEPEFRLKTPAMILAVKGTSFFASVLDGEEIAGVNEGKIEAERMIQGTTRSAPIIEGNALELDAEAARLRKLSAEELAYQETYGELETAIDEASKPMGVPGEARTWKDVDGKTINGVLISVSDTNIKLEVNGRAFDLPISRLSAADQAYIESIKDSL